MIEFAMEHTGSIRKAALVLGVSDSFLNERVIELGCKKPEVDSDDEPATRVPVRAKDKEEEDDRALPSSNVVNMAAARAQIKEGPEQDDDNEDDEDEDEDEDDDDKPDFAAPQGGPDDAA